METKSEKCCTRCSVKKPLFDFSDHPSMTDGKQSQCKDCFSERARLRRVGKPCMSCGKPKEVGVPKGAKLCISCAKTCYECKSEPRQKQHRLCKKCSAARDKIRNATPLRQTKGRITRIVTKYKVSREFATELSMRNECEACKKKLVTPRDTHVDHCHATGEVRGVLCFNCNAALGHLNDDTSRMTKLIQYLAKFETRKLETRNGKPT